jgi:predicted nucleic acid-binding protein
MPGRFFDTNVLLYLVSNDEAKADHAEREVAQGGTISVQVLNELANVSRRKMRMDWSETRALLGLTRSLLSVAPISVETHDMGLELAERYGLSIYDAMIAAAALGADCDVLYSEDMQDGLLIDDRLRVTNPFVEARGSAREQKQG